MHFVGTDKYNLFNNLELPNVIQRCYCKEKLDAGHTFRLKGSAVMLRVVNAPQITVRMKGLAVLDQTCSN